MCTLQLTARLVVFESTGAWAVRLRRALVPGGARVYEVRSWSEIPRLLSDAPASLLVIELTSENLESLGGWLRQLGRDYSHVRAAVVGSRQLADTEWFLREQGAVIALFSPRDVVLLADLWRRHAALFRQDASSVRRQLWQQLPWPGDVNTT